MTVQELIDELQSIEDKTQSVAVEVCGFEKLPLDPIVPIVRLDTLEQTRVSVETGEATTYQVLVPDESYGDHNG